MHSARVLRAETNAFKCLNNPSHLSRRPSRVTRLPTLQHRRTASIVGSPEVPENGEDGNKPSPTPPAPSPAPSRARGRPKTSKGLDGKSGETVFSLPADLADHLLWLPEENLVAKESSLPPEEMIQEALANLLVSFHPKTQHRATYTTSAGPPIEPTVTLYCPIEGGTYVIDAAVMELARRTDADVLVLDALDLLAGEWGPFGKAASALQLPSNPLQLGELQTQSSYSRAEESDDDEEISPHPFGQMLEGLQMGGGRPPFGITMRARRSSANSSSQTAKKNFFHEFVNLQRTDEEGAPMLNPADPSSSRPRLIYCRDLHLLSESLPHWYSHFIDAVKARRQGPMARPGSPVQNPTVVVLGVSPSIITPRNASSSSGPTGLVNYVMNRNRPPSKTPHAPPANPKVVEWDESPAAQRARDKRLHERLNDWEKHDASVFYSELPNLHAASSDPSGMRMGPQRGLMSLFVAIPENGGGPPSIMPAPMEDDGSKDRGTDHSRLTVILPRQRDPAQEIATRVERRLQANQINMRTAVGSIGGYLNQAEGMSPEKFFGETEELTSNDNERMRTMLLDWSQRVETWQKTRLIADRAMGSFVADKLGGVKVDRQKSALESTALPWSTIAESWDMERASRVHRRDFLSSFTTKPGKRQIKEEGAAQTEEAEEDEGAESDAETSDVDELLEQLKRDPSLDQYEQRLLGSIVNPKNMPTTFAQVHLPPATIDSIRTIVSLPLLHPSAFGYGILKQHTMNGALLFGAPGTGKTLSIRALARESGARMMIIKPSDVMDMYVGEGEKLVRGVFNLARRISPCVVFIDEIDALLGARVSGRGGGGDLAHRGVITEFMQEMDGLKTNKDTNVVVIGATNRPFDLDDAVLRRLPRRLLIDLPGEKERDAILRILLADEQLGKDINITALAKRTESFSGSDLKHLCVAAALDAVKEHAKLPWVTPRDTPLPSLSSEPSSTLGDLGGNPSIQTQSPSSGNTDNPSAEAASPESETDGEAGAKRILRMSHFEKALKEITPSASEQLGSLADLRKWNEEFGEGGRKRGKKIWGGKFGFIVKPGESEEGKVQQP
ncbi:hypothetical protein M408DRAFT_126811 [Serendipita vermifera MAFF 305830]|uniref:AAA+ ATPase domain-containing protein n=1 Tax=Serendipita vermifera MAFF 305830 TaxID=933852 RepID=A0A0C3AWX1_SERVB|nr:hypothetical protein M408DRAFT_126811 [Serendipita vermifera MAFF 305830]